MVTADLLAITNSLETKAGASTSANNTDRGYWQRIRAAAEDLANATSVANATQIGDMLRTAVALEVTAGGSGAQENASYDGFLKRIVDALEIKASTVYSGSIENRFKLSAAGAVFGASFTPASVPNIRDYYEVRAAKLWQDTAGTIAVTTDGQSVARWDSELGTMANMLQGTAGNRPTYKFSGGVEWLDGVTDDFMTYAATGLGGVTTATTPFYLAKAVKLDTLGATQTISDGVGGARALIFADQVAAVNRWRMHGTAGFNAEWGATPTTNDAVVACLFNGASSAIRLDGVTGTTADSGTGSLEGGGAVAAGPTGSNPIDGRLYGYVLVAANPSNADKASIDTWLAALQGRTI